MKRGYVFANRSIRRLNITNRFLLVFFVVIVIPLAFLSIYNTLTLKKSINEKVIRASEQAMRSFNFFISEETDKYVDYSYNVSKDYVTQQLLKRSNEGLVPEAIQSIYSDESGLIDIVWTETLSNIMILDISREPVYNLGSVDVPFSQVSKLIYEMSKYKKNIMWACEQGEDKGNHILFIKKIYDKDNEDVLIGFLIYTFSEERFFEKIYNNLDFGGNSNTFILNKELQYISSQYDKDKIGSYLFNEDIDIVNGILKADKGSFDGEYNGERVMFLFEKNTDLDWYVITTINKEYMEKELISTAQNLIVVLIGIIAICFLFILFISRTIIGPVNSLIAYTDKIRKGDYNAQIHNDIPDEIGKLIENNKVMVDRFIVLMDEVKQNEIKRREMELDNLQYQINPHFIFNTLNVFKNIAQINDVYTISEGIEVFSHLLRQTIVNRNEIITLEQEIENLKCYEAIQQYKYICAFEVRYEIAKSVLDYKIPKLLLQPILENSIMHGMIEDKVLEIEVIAQEEDTCVKIMINDNGRGSKMEVDNGIKKMRFSGIGLKNIQERIKLIYGEEGRLIFKSYEGEGTQVSIYLPKDKIGEGD